MVDTDNDISTTFEKAVDNIDSVNSDSIGRRFVSVKSSTNNSDVYLENKNLEKYIFVGILEITLNHPSNLFVF